MTCFPFSNNRRCWETYQPLTGMLAIGLDNYMANYLNAASKNVKSFLLGHNQAIYQLG